MALCPICKADTLTIDFHDQRLQMGAGYCSTCIGRVPIDLDKDRKLKYRCLKIGLIRETLTRASKELPRFDFELECILISLPELDLQRLENELTNGLRKHGAFKEIENLASYDIPSSNLPCEFQRIRNTHPKTLNHILLRFPWRKESTEISMTKLVQAQPDLQVRLTLDPLEQGFQVVPDRKYI